MAHLSSSLRGAALLALLLASPAVFAQNVYNAGSIISLAGGAVLYAPGDVTNASVTNGGVTTNGTLSLGNGTLQVGGNLVNQTGNTLTAGTGKVVLSGAAQQTLTTNGASLYDLTVSNTSAATAGVDVTSPLTVTRELLLTSGMVYARGANRVVLPDGAIISNEANGRFVAGNLEVQRTTLPLNTGTNFLNGVIINPRANNLGAVSVTRTAGLKTTDSHGVNPNNATQQGIDQIWRIVPTTAPAAGSPAQVNFTWLSDNDNGLTGSFNQSQVWQRANDSSPWLPVGSMVDASGRSITVDAASFGPLTVSTAAAPLPVELLAFTAGREGDAALLRWRTATERNSAYFGVEVSANGRSFRQLTKVAAQGNKASATDYQATDPALLSYASNTVYYRLRMVDTDGQESYSPVRTVLVSGGSFAAEAYPNPAGTAGTSLQVRTATAGPADVLVYDALGRQLLRRDVVLTAGTNTVELSAAGRLATGTYFVKVRQDKQQTVLKLTRE